MDNPINASIDESINESIIDYKGASVISESVQSSILVRKRSVINDQFTTWQRLESLCGLFSLFSLLAIIFDYEQSSSSSAKYTCSLSDIEHGNDRILVVIISFSTIYLLVCRFISESKWLEMTFYITTGKSVNYIQRRHKFNRKVQLVFEILILIIMPIPYYDAIIKLPQYFSNRTVLFCYRLDTLLIFLCTSRIYFCIRALINYSIFHNEQALLFCIINDVSTGLGFAIKCLVKTHPYKIIGWMALVTILIGSLFARIFERPIDLIQNQFYDYIPNYMWLMVESISTLGYGEASCSSYGCRAIICMTWFFGSVFVGLLIGAMQQTTELTKNESQAFSMIRNTHSSVKMLTAWVRLIEAKKKNQGFEKIRAAKDALDSAAKDCRQSRLFAKSQSKKEDSEIKKDIASIRAKLAISSIKLDQLISQYD